MRLWDTLLAAEGPSNDDDNPMMNDEAKVKRFTYMDFIVVAAVINVREKVVEGNDFATGMELLQKAAQKFRFRKPRGVDSDEDEDDNDQIYTKIKSDKGINAFE